MFPKFLKNTAVLSLILCCSVNTMALPIQNNTAQTYQELRDFCAEAISRVNQYHANEDPFVAYYNMAFELSQNNTEAETIRRNNVIRARLEEIISDERINPHQNITRTRIEDEVRRLFHLLVNRNRIDLVRTTDREFVEAFIQNYPLDENFAFYEDVFMSVLIPIFVETFNSFAHQGQ